MGGSSVNFGNSWSGGEGVVLAVAHPGHELRLSTWIGRERPLVLVLTTGSRNGSDRTRVAASAALAGALGAEPGPIFGRHLDREVYRWAMEGRSEPFAALAEELADVFLCRRARRVVVDSWQLYNVVHDLWHLTVRAAAAMASRRLGEPIACYDYPVVPQSPGMPAAGPQRLGLRLAPAQVERKLALARAFPGIAGDVAEVLRAGGRAFLAGETLHALRPVSELAPPPGAKPLYESFGEARVAAGLYSDVLRWRHVAPIVERLGAQLEAAVEPA